MSSGDESGPNAAPGRTLHSLEDANVTASQNEIHYQVEEGPPGLYQPTVVASSFDTTNLPDLHPASLNAHLASEAAEDERLKPFLDVANAYLNNDESEAKRAMRELERKTSPEVDHGVRVESEMLSMRALANWRFDRTVRDARLPPAALMALAMRAELGIEIVDFGDSSPPHFENWGKTVRFEPDHTLVVTKITGVQEIVKLAAEMKKKVRVAGFRHTWSDLYGESGGFVIMFLPYSCLTALPYQPPPPSFQSELSGITLVDSVQGRTAPAGHHFCKIMAGTTNAQFREWCYTIKAWCIPFNVIMLEVTFGGTNAPICHGAGLTSKTLSDLVVEVEYVDAYGEVRVVSDPEQLRVASGAFGLLGVVVSLTLQLDDMAVAELQPVKRLAALAVPPPRGYKIPEPVLAIMKQKGISVDGEEMKKAREDFAALCEDNYYVEFFWFPYQDNVWVNAWKTRPKEKTQKDANLDEYPGDGWFSGASAQALQERMAETIVNKWEFNHLLSGRSQAWVLGLAAMWALPHIPDANLAVQTYVSEALHFRRGIQNFRVWDMEWEIPIPKSTGSGKRDYATVQHAWWDAITEMYANVEDAPVRVALEMRLTGSSDIILAPQRGNQHGTASIEVLTTLGTGQEVWQTFCQTMTKHWTSYQDPKGEYLNARPHWAKQWKGLKVRGEPIEDYFTNTAYAEAFPEFKVGFKALVGSDEAVQDTLARFADPTIARLIFRA